MTVLLVGLLIASLATIVGLFSWRRGPGSSPSSLSGVILAIDLGWWLRGEARYLSMLLNVIAVFYLNQRDVRLALHGEVAT